MFLASLAFTGDILIHNRLAKRALSGASYNFDSFFSEILGEISDVSLAGTNLESLTAGDHHGITGYPRFNAPVALLDSIRESGFSLINIANNHMLDLGEKGLVGTIQNLESRGLNYVGAASDKVSTPPVVVREVAGIKVGFASFTDASKLKLEEIQDSTVNHFPGEYRNVRMIRRTRPIKNALTALQDSADLRILQLHFGEEYHRYPSAFQREVVRSVAESGVDLIVCHHPHVLQPLEWVENSRGKPVLVMHSLGNFLSGQLGVHRQIGAILKVSIHQSSSGLLTLSPHLTLTYVDQKAGYRIKPLKTVVEQYLYLESPGVEKIESNALYDRVLEHSRTYIPSLSVS